MKISDAQVDEIVRRFAQEHHDYEEFRPTMYQLSCFDCNEDKSLPELYEMAKEIYK